MDKVLTGLETEVSTKSRSVFRAVVANTSVLLSGKAANAVLSLGFTALAARALGIHDFGILVLVHAFVQAVKDIASFQSWQTILHYGTGPLEDGRLFLFQRVLRFSFLLDLVGSVAGLVIALLCINLVGPQLGFPQDSSASIMLYMTVILFMASTTQTGVLRLFDRFDLLAMQSGIASLVRLVGAGFLYVSGGKLMSFLLVWYLAELVAGIFLFFFAWAQLRKRGCLQGFRWFRGGITAELPGIWRFCWSTNFNMTLSLAFTHVGTLLVGWFLGPTDAALYRVARQIGNSIVRPASLVTQALYPEFARLWASGGLKSLYRLAVEVSLAAGGVASLLLLVVAFGGAAILGLIMGAEFVGAAPVMNWVVAASVVGVWSLPLEPLLISTGRAMTAMVTQAAVVALYLPLLCFALSWFGLMGAGYAAFAAQMLLLLGRGWFVLRSGRGHLRADQAHLPASNVSDT